MNWFLIMVGIIFLIGLIVGIVRGGVRIAVSLAATIVTLILVFVLTPYVSKAIYSLTPLDDMIESTVLNKFSSVVTTSGLSGMDEDSLNALLEEYGISEKALEAAGITIDDILSGNVDSELLEKYGIPSGILSGQTTAEEAQEALEDADIPRQLQMTAIQNADIPAIFKSLLSDNNNSEVYESLGVTSFVDYAAAYLAKIIIDIIAFLATFVLITIVLRAVIFALDIVTQLPVLGMINRLAGAAAGLLLALIVVDVIYIVITLLYTTGFGQSMFALIESNSFLSFLYNHNIIMRMATTFR
ncbi:MAG: CvpA family protein [Lachnospiraceae bacterium]